MQRRITRDDLRNYPELAKKGKSLNQMHDFSNMKPVEQSGEKKTRSQSPGRVKTGVKNTTQKPAKQAVNKKSAVKKAAPKKSGGKATKAGKKK